MGNEDVAKTPKLNLNVGKLSDGGKKDTRKGDNRGRLHERGSRTMSKVQNQDSGGSKRKMKSELGEKKNRYIEGTFHYKPY